MQKLDQLPFLGQLTLQGAAVCIAGNFRRANCWVASCRPAEIRLRIWLLIRLCRGQGRLALNRKTDMKTNPSWSSHQAKSFVDLWIGPAQMPPETLTDYLNVISSEEQQRFGRLRLESDRRRYLVSRILLRTALTFASKGKVDPRFWRYETNKYGKLAIVKTVGLPRLNFSLSHSKRLAVVAVSSKFDVGIDIEFLDRTAVVDPADVVLSRGERVWLSGRPSSSRWFDFLKLWTVKEAYVKLLGKGAFLDFSSFEIGMEPLRMVRTEAGDRQPADLHLTTREIRTNDGVYQLSLATRCRAFKSPRVALHVFDSRLIESKHQDLLRAG